ncbi:unnamed protein product [Orchesella dallaii]|uniref:Uncharacterized protein n=1 Tax=Orchesella dallaii TaxID=48710 RepID=A0ABP1QZR8_9HEXA
MKPQHGILNSLLSFLKEKQVRFDQLNLELREYNETATKCQEKLEALHKESGDETGGLRRILDKCAVLRTQSHAFDQKLRDMYYTLTVAFNKLTDLKRNCEESGSESNMDLFLPFLMDEEDAIDRARNIDLSTIHAEWTALNLGQRLKNCVVELEKLKTDNSQADA